MDNEEPVTPVEEEQATSPEESSCIYDLGVLKEDFKEAQDTNIALKNGIEDAAATMYNLEEELEKI